MILLLFVHGMLRLTFASCTWRGQDVRGYSSVITATSLCSQLSFPTVVTDHAELQTMQRIATTVDVLNMYAIWWINLGAMNGTDAKTVLGAPLSSSQPRSLFLICMIRNTCLRTFQTTAAHTKRIPTASALTRSTTICWRDIARDWLC